MEVITLALDKFVSYRMEGLNREDSFVAAKLEVFRYLMDFVYHAGGTLDDHLYSEMVYITEDVRFTQTAEYMYQETRREEKRPTVATIGSFS